MSDLERLLAQSKKVKIGDIDVEVHSLDIEDITETLKLADNNPEIKAQAIKTLLMKSLKKSFPDAMEEQLKRFDLKYLNDYIKAIYEVSGMEIDEKKLEKMTAAL